MLLLVLIQDEENELWQTTKKARMPSYYELLQMEVEELLLRKSPNQNPNALSFISLSLWLICICGLGHAFTDVGRRAYTGIIYKYLNFTKACFGVWTEQTVEQYVK